RSFDVASFVAFGAAQLGVAGNDVLMEFDYSEIYAPLDLDIGHCRMAVATPEDEAEQEDPRSWSHIRVATKYPEIARRHFAARGRSPPIHGRRGSKPPSAPCSTASAKVRPMSMLRSRRSSTTWQVVATPR